MDIVSDKAVDQQINNFQVRYSGCVEYKLEYEIYTIIQSEKQN